jgi:hypothetical protein
LKERNKETKEEKRQLKNEDKMETAEECRRKKKDHGNEGRKSKHEGNGV